MLKILAMMREIKDTSKWKDILCLWLERIMLLKYLYYRKLSIDSMQFIWKLQWHFSQKYLKNLNICTEA